jgi:hypothetical protein
MEDENYQETDTEETTSQDTADDVTSTDDSDGEESAEALKARITELEETNKQLYARAKKVPKKVEPKHNSNLTREEAILFAKGYTEEEVDLANKLAKVNDTSVLVAAEDDYVKGKVQERLNTEKSAKASLGASNGSSIKTTKPVGKMTEEEHAKLFHETMSKV